MNATRVVQYLPCASYLDSERFVFMLSYGYISPVYPPCLSNHVFGDGSHGHSYYHE